MKNLILFAAGLTLWACLAGCKKSSSVSDPTQFTAALYCKNGGNFISFPVSAAKQEDIGNIHTTLISGQSADTAAAFSSIRIRVYGDTIRTYKGQELLLAYTDNNGITWNNTTDTTNTVVIERFDKIPEGMVRGSFTIKLANASGKTLVLDNGYFTIHYKD